MHSTFWTDGYRDGLAERVYAPPSHLKTSVFTAEYQRGYNAGLEKAIERKRGSAPYRDALRQEDAA